MSSTPQTLYDAIGGEPTFHRLVARFFTEVAADEILMGVYPADDLDGAEERLRLFLIQRAGGPTTYSDARGHPRLRMRHVPFAIGAAERAAWIRAMRVAFDEAEIAEPYGAELWEYLETTAHSMQNRPG